VYDIDCTSSITDFTQDKSEVENSKLPVTRKDDDDSITVDSVLHDNDIVITDDNSDVKKLTTSRSYTDGDTSRAGSDSVLNNTTKPYNVNVTEV